MLIILLGSLWSPRWPMRWFALDHEVNPLWCRWDDCIHGNMVPVRTAMADLVFPWYCLMVWVVWVVFTRVRSGLDDTGGYCDGVDANGTRSCGG